MAHQIYQDSWLHGKLSDFNKFSQFQSNSSGVNSNLNSLSSSFKTAAPVNNTPTPSTSTNSNNNINNGNNPVIDHPIFSWPYGSLDSIYASILIALISNEPGILLTCSENDFKGLKENLEKIITSALGLKSAFIALDKDIGPKQFISTLFKSSQQHKQISSSSLLSVGGTTNTAKGSTSSAFHQRKNYPTQGMMNQKKQFKPVEEEMILKDEGVSSSVESLNLSKKQTEEDSLDLNINNSASNSNTPTTAFKYNNATASITLTTHSVNNVNTNNNYSSTYPNPSQTTLRSRTFTASSAASSALSQSFSHSMRVSQADVLGFTMAPGTLTSSVNMSANNNITGYFSSQIYSPPNVFIIQDLHLARESVQNIILQMMAKRRVQMNDSHIYLPQPTLIIGVLPIEISWRSLMSEYVKSQFIFVIDYLHQYFISFSNELNSVPKAEYEAIRSKSQSIFVHKDIEAYTQRLIRFSRNHELILQGPHAKIYPTIISVAKCLAVALNLDHITPSIIDWIFLNALAHQTLFIQDSHFASEETRSKFVTLDPRTLFHQIIMMHQGFAV